MKKTFIFEGREEDINTLSHLFRHMEYLGQVGASRNLVVRVDGDGNGRIHVYNEDGTSIDNEKYNLEQQEYAVVGIYDIGD